MSNKNFKPYAEVTMDGKLAGIQEAIQVGGCTTAKEISQYLKEHGHINPLTKGPWSTETITKNFRQLRHHWRENIDIDGTIHQLKGKLWDDLEWVKQEARSRWEETKATDDENIAFLVAYIQAIAKQIAVLEIKKTPEDDKEVTNYERRLEIIYNTDKEAIRYFERKIEESGGDED